MCKFKIKNFIFYNTKSLQKIIFLFFAYNQIEFQIFTVLSSSTLKYDIYQKIIKFQKECLRRISGKTWLIVFGLRMKIFGNILNAESFTLICLFSLGTWLYTLHCLFVRQFVCKILMKCISTMKKEDKWKEESMQTKLKRARSRSFTYFWILKPIQ